MGWCVVFDSGFGFELPYLVWAYSLAEEIFVVLEGSISGAELVVWRAITLLEAGVFVSHTHLSLHHTSEVPSSWETVMGYDVVHGCWLVVVVVLETGSVGVPEEEWHEGVSVVDGVEFVTFKELL